MRDDTIRLRWGGWAAMGVWLGLVGCDPDPGTGRDLDPGPAKSDTTASDAELRPTTNSNVQLLAAWDPLHDKTAANFCVTPVGAPRLSVGERQDTFDITFISGKEHLATQLGVDVTLRGSIGSGASADAKLRLLDEFDRSTNVMSYLVRIESRFSIRPRGELALSDAGLEAARQGPERFVRECGTHFVRAIQYGTELYVMITLSTSNESVTAELEASLDASSGDAIPGASLEGSFGAKLSSVAAREDVDVSISVATRGFALPIHEDEGPLLAELTAGTVNERMYAALQELRASMIASTTADIEAITEDADAVLGLDATPTAVSAAFYSGLHDWPDFGPNALPYADVLGRGQSNEAYLRSLGELLERMRDVYERELAPFDAAEGSARASFQTRAGLPAAVSLEELSGIAEAWIEEFLPARAGSSQVGWAYERVESAFEDCFARSAENGLHACGPDDRAALSVSEPWHTTEELLAEYHAVDRLVRLRYWAGDEAVATHAGAREACEAVAFSQRNGGGRGRLPTKQEAVSLALLVASGNLDWSDAEAPHAIWYQQSADDGAACDLTCVGAGSKQVMVVTPERTVEYACDCDSYLWGDEILPVCVPPDGPRARPLAP